MYHIFFIYSSVDGNLDCFHVLFSHILNAWGGSVACVPPKDEAWLIHTQILKPVWGLYPAPQLTLSITLYGLLQLNSLSSL